MNKRKKWKQQRNAFFFSHFVFCFFLSFFILFSSSYSKGGRELDIKGTITTNFSYSRRTPCEGEEEKEASPKTASLLLLIALRPAHIPSLFSLFLFSVLSPLIFYASLYIPSLFVLLVVGRTRSLLMFAISYFSHSLLLLLLLQRTQEETQAHLSQRLTPNIA